MALTSKYKSEFLANMSHELRTPLNNLLILARVLADNTEGNLSSKQIKFAETIHSSGTDLLALINDILDLSKIESGQDGRRGRQRAIRGDGRLLRARRSGMWRKARGSDFTIEVGAEPAARSDAHGREAAAAGAQESALERAQVHRAGIGEAAAWSGRVSGWSPTHPVLNRAKSVIAFSVTDTGIGIAQEKQRIIFEAFQQADGTTSRKYGGTGLGLSISRELARLLGGEIRLQSAFGEGSIFTLYLPQVYISAGSEVRMERDAARALEAGGTRERARWIVDSPSGRRHQCRRSWSKRWWWTTTAT